MIDLFYGEVMLIISSFALAGILGQLIIDFFFPVTKSTPLMCGNLMAGMMEGARS